MTYGEAHIRIIPNPNIGNPYDWAEEEQDDTQNEKPEVASVTSITRAPSLERVALSRTVTLIGTQVTLAEFTPQS